MDLVKTNIPMLWLVVRFYSTQCVCVCVCVREVVCICVCVSVKEIAIA